MNKYITLAREHRAFVIVSSAILLCIVAVHLLFVYGVWQCGEFVEEGKLYGFLSQIVILLNLDLPSESLKGLVRAVDNFDFQGKIPILSSALFVFFVVFYIFYFSPPKKKFLLLVILLLFLLSFVIRLPNLNRNLSCHHEWITAQSMIALENWNDQGAIKHRFCVLQSYPLEADKNILNTGIRLMSQDGNGYYTSFPPFSIIFPYIVFKSLFIPINIFNLQLFNLFLSFTATLFIYFTIRSALPPESNRGFSALLGCVVFLFSSSTLWYFSNTYSWDIFWHYIWVIGIFYIMKLIQDIANEEFKGSSLTIFGLITFFMCYAEYQGLLYALSVVLYVFVKKKKIKYYKEIIGTIIVGSGSALLLTFIQYSSIRGVSAYLHVFIRAFNQRSFIADFSYWRILQHYAFGFSAVAVLIVLSIIILFRKKTKMARFFESTELTLLYFSAFPIIVHHLLLLNWTSIHDYSVVKAAPFFAFLAAILFGKIRLNVDRNRISVALLSLVLACSMTLSIFIYQFYFTHCSRTDLYHEIGDTIKKNSSDEETIFAISPVHICPEIIYYSERNIQTLETLDEIRDWMQQYDKDKGVVYYFNEDCKIEKMKRIRL